MDALKLQALAQTSIEDATAAYLDGGTLRAWRGEMERIITRTHTAAYLNAAAERLGVSLDSSALLSQRRLSRAERQELRQAVDAQLAYLDGFQRDIAAGARSEAQIRARANLYSAAGRGTFYTYRYGDWDLPFVPGVGTACGVNCRCSASVADNGDGTGVYTYQTGETRRHCATCPSRAGSYEVRRRAA